MKTAAMIAINGDLINVIVADAGIDACPDDSAVLKDVTNQRHFFPGHWNAQRGFFETPANNGNGNGPP